MVLVNGVSLERLAQCLGVHTSDHGTKRHCTCRLILCPELRELRTPIDGLSNLDARLNLAHSRHRPMWARLRCSNPMHRALGTGSLVESPLSAGGSNEGARVPEASWLCGCSVVGFGVDHRSQANCGVEPDCRENTTRGCPFLRVIVGPGGQTCGVASAG